MNLNQLKKFAQHARRKLITEVSARLDYLLNHDNAYIRAHQTEIGEIRRQLGKKSREQLIEEVAYTWFNRIVALRYMDLRVFGVWVLILSPILPAFLFHPFISGAVPVMAVLHNIVGRFGINGEAVYRGIYKRVRAQKLRAIGVSDSAAVFDN